MYQNRNYRKRAFIILAFLLLYGVGNYALCSGATYLDGSTTGCTDGSRSYSPSTRSCGSGSDTVYLTLASFVTNLTPSATNYIREGKYFRDSGSKLSGSLHIPSTKSGSATSPTIIKAYPSEELKVTIGTAQRGATYNSNPSDSTGTGSWGYYPNPSIMTYDANYVVIDGVRAYGQVYILGGHDVTIQNSDLGGGGGSGTITSDQGNTVRFNYVYNALLKNNLIHYNCRRVESNDGSLVIGYAFTAVLEQNTFYDGYGTYFEDKDGSGQTGRTTEVKYNFFAPSNISPIATVGVRGFNQAQQTSYQYIHHNIFQNLSIGINVIGAPAIDNVFYNNTFVNCATDVNQPSSSITGSFFELYNNLFYHSNTGQAFIRVYSLNQLLGSNFNVYYNTAIWGSPSTTTASNLSAWQAYSSMDSASINGSPNFVNATGSKPGDFKRASYFENFGSSKYSTRAGAYETGNEQIGYNATGSIAVIPPSGVRPTNITK